MDGNWNGASPNVKNKYQYNEKELITDFELDWNDYGFRMYDAAIGRFSTIDPLADVYDYQTSYAYADNNPVNYIDFMGLGRKGFDDQDEGDPNVAAAFEPPSDNKLSICPTCPSDKKYDDYRNSEHLYLYLPETDQATLTSEDALVTAKRDYNFAGIVADVDNIGDRVDPFIGLTVLHLANKINDKLLYHSFPKSEGFVQSLNRVKSIKTMLGSIKAAKAFKLASALGKAGTGLNVISAVKYMNDINNGQVEKGLAGLAVMGATTAAIIFCPPCALAAIAVSAGYSLYLEDVIFEPEKK